MRRWSVALIPLLLSLSACGPEVLQPEPVGPSNGWEIIHPLPGGYDLRAVMGTTTTNIWAVGAHGVIVHWDGTTVRRVDSPVTSELLAIDGWARDDLYAGGGDAVVHYDGRVWNILRRFPDEEVADLLCAPDGRLYVLGTMGLWCRDTTGWRRIEGPGENGTSVWTGPGDQVRIGAGSWIWKLSDGLAEREQEFGTSQVRGGDGSYVWTESASGVAAIRAYTVETGWSGRTTLAYSCAAIADLGELVYADNGGIHRGGRVWSSDAGRWIYGLTRGPDGTLLACGYGGTLMSAEASADTLLWRDSAAGLGFRHINAFDGTGCQDIWAGEWWGRVLHFDGRDWSVEHSPLPGDTWVSNVQVVSGGWLVAQGGDRIALRSPAGVWNLLPAPGGDLYRTCALAPDSIVVATASLFRVWNGTAWRDAGPTEGTCWGLSVTPGRQVYALMVDDATSTLRRWNGNAFTIVASAPMRTLTILGASRSTEVLWLGGHAGSQPVVYRFDEDGLREVAASIPFSSWPTALTELRPDDLFMLAGHEVWRFQGGQWTSESGLPVEGYTIIWSHPDCGVFVEGHPTFYKAFPLE
jgi:hypothetical protein